MALLEIGDRAPAFQTVDQDGEPVKLSDFRGKKVVLYFYPKDDTPGCTKEACGFRDSWSELKKLGAVVLGVSADDAASSFRISSRTESSAGRQSSRQKRSSSSTSSSWRSRTPWRRRRRRPAHRLRPDHAVPRGQT